jgi:hypothetical protein
VRNQTSQKRNNNDFIRYSKEWISWRTWWRMLLYLCYLICYDLRQWTWLIACGYLRSWLQVFIILCVLAKQMQWSWNSFKKLTLRWPAFSPFRSLQVLQ